MNSTRVGTKRSGVLSVARCAPCGVMCCFIDCVYVPTPKVYVADNLEDDVT